MSASRPTRIRTNNRKAINKALRKKRQFTIPMFLPAAGALEEIKTDIPETKFVKVTPETALMWLDESNIKNRKVRQYHVDNLANDMANGKWKGRNAEPIKFDKNGRMIEGQHRCRACVQAGVPFETLLVTNCEPEDYNTSGIGISKKFADFLGPNFEQKNVTLLASCVRLVYHWQHGTLGKGNVKSQMVPISELEETFLANPKLPDSVAYVAAHKDVRSMINPTYAALVHYAGTLSRRTPSVELFLERVGTGLELLPNHPEYLLRQFLLKEKHKNKNEKRHQPIYILALIIKAWNYSKNNETVKELRFKPNEEFPKL